MGESSRSAVQAGEATVPCAQLLCSCVAAILLASTPLAQEIFWFLVCTWTSKVCRLRAFWIMFKAFGPLFY